MLNRLVALAAACLLACAPALAQDTRTLPVASPLTGAEKLPAVQGAGCPSKTTPCAAVAVTPSLIATFLAPTFQAKDADLDAIAALSTVDFGRQLLTRADAASVRSAIGLGTATVAPAPVAATLQGSWVNFGSGYSPAQYYRSLDQRVTLEGLVKGGADGTLFTLPAGYRPAADLLFVSYKNGGTVAIGVKATGAVTLTNSSTDFSSLAGVSFYATQ